MPVQAERPRHRGIPLPPSGWTLAVLLVLYIFTGLIGHDPWKNDDAITIGVVHDLVSNGNWLTPSLAGRPYPDAPLYYWVAAASGSPVVLALAPA
jgi:4-amino-4-deoxy-L-arabinose transferase-like glycosyltransferase